MKCAAFMLLFLMSIQSIKAQQLSDTTSRAAMTDSADKVFTMVEQEAEFPGGLAGWKTYIIRNLNPDVPTSYGAPEGYYRVLIRFIVEKNGNISEVKAESKCGFGMEAEAIRVITMGPKWIPAKQNGKNVNAYHRQPITFVVRR